MFDKCIAKLILIFLFIAIPAGYLKAAGDAREDNLMELLEIKPGMAILDIGTGAGYYAYKFAKRLNGTGRVFATDIKIESINYVAKEARKMGLMNLYPVLVKGEGVDEFYSKHKYDLIFFSNVYFLLDSPVKYLKEMRNFLAENGRLVILNYTSLYLRFFLEDFTDFEGLINDLLLEPASSPFYKSLRISTRKLLKQKPNGGSNELLKYAIVDDFNRMLVNPRFYNNFLNGISFKRKVSFTPEEMDLANRLLQLLKLKSGVSFYIGIIQKYLSAGQFRGIMCLNKLLIIQRFRKYLYEGGTAPYLSKAGVCRDIQEDKRERYLEDWITTAIEHLKEAGYNLKDGGRNKLLSIENEKMRVRRTLEESGYKLENEYEFIPFRIILFFKANKDAAQ